MGNAVPVLYISNLQCGTAGSPSLAVS